MGGEYWPNDWRKHHDEWMERRGFQLIIGMDAHGHRISWWEGQRKEVVPASAIVAQIDDEDVPF